MKTLICTVNVGPIYIKPMVRPVRLPTELNWSSGFDLKCCALPILNDSLSTQYNSNTLTTPSFIFLWQTVVHFVRNWPSQKNFNSGSPLSLHKALSPQKSSRNASSFFSSPLRPFILTMKKLLRPHHRNSTSTIQYYTAASCSNR